MMMIINSQTYFCFVVLFIGPSIQTNLTDRIVEALKRFIQSDCGCLPYSCCSKWGYCGRTEAYCGDGCQSGPCRMFQKRSDDPSTLLKLHTFNCIFPNLENDKKNQYYYILIEAMKTSKWKVNSTVELAIFLAHVSYTTKGLTKLSYPCSKSEDCEHYRRNECSIDIPLATNYHPRGMFPLAYPCHYYYAGQALGIDLLNDPDIVSESNRLAALTAIWFYKYTGMNQLAARGDFVGTIRQLNKNPCSNRYDHQEFINRTKIYHKVRRCFGLTEIKTSYSC